MTTYEKIAALIAELEADEKKTDMLFDADRNIDFSLILCNNDEYLNALADAVSALKKIKAYY